MIIKKLAGVLILVLFAFSICAQKHITTNSVNGKFYAYWGWNSSSYSKSNIHFKGSNYDFTLLDIKAKDRQSVFSLEEYFGIKHFSIPQYNMRFGYYLNNKWDVSLGVDHMKYVMIDNQNVYIDGVIAISNPKYDGVYHHEAKYVNTDFLTFEHTDGLNYINPAVRRNQRIVAYKQTSLTGFLGVGLGLLLPKSNVKLMENTRHDAFHISGWGADATGGLKLRIGQHFFIQSEVKVGYINMPDILTTYSMQDRASQHFTYLQSNILFGFDFSLSKRKK